MNHPCQPGGRTDQTDTREGGPNRKGATKKHAEAACEGPKKKEGTMDVRFCDLQARNNPPEVVACLLLLVVGARKKKWWQASGLTTQAQREGLCREPRASAGVSKNR